MHFQSLITIIALLALTPTLIFAQNATLNAPLNFNCSTFTAPPGGPANLNTTAPSNQTIRVSRAVICAANAASNDPSCSISAGGLVNITATSNATDIPDARVLHAMLARYLNSSGAFSPFDTFIKNQRFNASGTPTRVPPGKAAYVGFTANMTCYDGIVSTPDSCDSSDQGIRNVKEKFENRPLRICVPVNFRTGPAKRRRTRIRGNTALVEVSEQEAKREDMQRNPAAQESSADDDEEEEDDQPRPRPSSSVLPGGSARMDVKWSAGVGIGVALWMVGFM